MKRICTVIALVAMITLTAGFGVATETQAMSIEAGIGLGYSPVVTQDANRLGSTYGISLVFASRVSPKIITELKGHYMTADDLSGEGSSRLYSGGLAAKYYSKPLYRSVGETSEEVFTRVNPFLRVELGGVDGAVAGESISTFLQYAVGAGVRWDPTETSGVFNVEFDVRTITSSGQDGRSLTSLGLYGQFNLEM